MGEDECGLVFFDFLLVNDLVEEVTTLCVLHDEVELFRGLDDLVELDDKGVSQFFHYLELSGYSDDIGVLKDKVFLENLYCD